MWGEGSRDQLDVRLQDDEMLEEIDLVAELMAAAGAIESLDQSTVDVILGVDSAGGCD